MARKIDNVVSSLSTALETDPKLSVARIRLLMLVKKYGNKGTTSQIAGELGMDGKYFRKFAAEAERAGYIEKERFSDDPSMGDCIRYKLTPTAQKLLKDAFDV